MNKPIPAIIRFREKFTIKTKEGLNLDDGKNIYAGSRGLTEDIETFLVAELLNERERILKEVEEKMDKTTGKEVISFQGSNNENLNDNIMYLGGIHAGFNYVKYRVLSELKEGGE